MFLLNHFYRELRQDIDRREFLIARINSCIQESGLGLKLVSIDKVVEPNDEQYTRSTV